jgi:hypothetical protein
MKIDEKIFKRFDELILVGNKLIQGASVSGGYEVNSENKGTDFLQFDFETRTRYIPKKTTVNKFAATEWGLNCLHILKKVFSEDSDYYLKFKNKIQGFESDDNFEYVRFSISFLRAAKNDYENGYIFNTRTLIEAEIFDDLLEQSEHLLSQGYFQASAVIAGCVLEDTLRKLCDKNNITFPKKPTIEPMNVELAKKGIYNQFIKDKVSSIGKLRNHAAHGEWTEFAQKDVEDMIRNVRRFMEDYFS